MFTSDQNIQKLLEETVKSIAEGYNKRFNDLSNQNEQIAHELEAAKSILLEAGTEILPRPKKHQHDPDEPNPVICFDFNETLTPTSEYPIAEPPFDKVKKWLDLFSRMGACLHITTSGLHYATASDKETYLARETMLKAYLNQFSLPIDLILPKHPADVYYDDRMVNVPKRNPDWDLVGEAVMDMLAPRFTVKNGFWIRDPKNRTGDVIKADDWPDPESVSGDKPRGYTGPRLDIDMHRTISSASSSLRTGDPMPGAVESVTTIFNIPVTTFVSCAGWNPKTHTKKDSEKRLAGLRVDLRENAIPYDQIVTKDHGDCYVDDKGICATDWEKDLPVIIKRLPKEKSLKPLHQ